MAHRLRDKRSVSHTVTWAGNGKMIPAHEVLDIFRNKRWLGNFFGCLRVFREDHIVLAQTIGVDFIARSGSRMKSIFDVIRVLWKTSI
jgi:hypothetical protein